MLPSRGVIRATPSLSIGSPHSIGRILPLARQLPSTPRHLSASRSFASSSRTSSNVLRVRPQTRAVPTIGLGLALGSRIGTPSMAAHSVALLRQQQLRNASWWNPVSYLPNAINPWGSSSPKPSMEPPPQAAAADAANQAATDTASSSTAAGADQLSSLDSAARPISDEAAAEISKLSEQFTAPDLNIGIDGLESFQEQLLTIPEQIGFLRALGLDFGWGPSSMCQWLIEHIHVWSGMPWWGTLAAAAILFRVGLFKFTMDSMEASGKLNLLFNHPKFKETMADMTAASQENDSARMMQRHQELATMKRMAGASFVPVLINLLTIPLGFGFFRVVRAMCDIPVPSMETGGVLWFTDLSIPDPYYILPFASAMGIVMLIKSTPTPSAKGLAMQKAMTWVMTPLMLVVSLRLAAGLQWFFVVTGLISIILNWLRLQPWFRVALGYSAQPPTPVDPISSSPSPLSPSAISYQPPRAAATASNPAVLPRAETIMKEGLNNGTASTKTTSGGIMDKLGLGPTINEVKGTWKEVSGMTEEKIEERKKKQAKTQAESYEERRAREEEEAIRARREAKRFRKGM